MARAKTFEEHFFKSLYANGYSEKIDLILEHLEKKYTEKMITKKEYLSTTIPKVFKNEPDDGIIKVLWNILAEKYGYTFPDKQENCIHDYNRAIKFLKKNEIYWKYYSEEGN